MEKDNLKSNEVMTSMIREGGLMINPVSSLQPRVNYLPETLELIKNTVAPKDLSVKEFELFIYQAKRTGLDPLSKQIYCIKSKEKVSIAATIDGLRLIAERTGLYEGQTPVLWCGLDGIWRDIWISGDNPAAAKVGVLKKGFTEPLYSVARFNTYAQRNFDGTLRYNWLKMPDFMIGKCAEALALRKAFPQELSNIYSTEEIEQSNEDQPEKKTKKIKEEVKPDFKVVVSNFLKTLKTKESLEHSYNEAKAREQYTELSKEEQAQLDELYLTLLGKLTPKKAEPKKSAEVKEKPVEEAKPKYDTSSMYVQQLMKAKDLSDLNRIYTDITEVPDILAPDKSELSKIDEAYNAMKGELK